MRGRAGTLSRQLWPLAALVLPLVLVASSLTTLARLADLSDLYLRSRAAAVAVRLENLPLVDEAPVPEALSEEEPALVEVRVFRPEQDNREAQWLAPIWEGRELFRTERVRLEQGEIFRAYIPFHSNGVLHVARIDLDASAADFILAPARRNLVISFASGLALVTLALYALWSLRRTAQFERRQLELEHWARLGRMAASLAHEIRNPLGTIKGFVQLAAERADRETAAMLSSIPEEIQRLERLVSDLLLYGRPPRPRPRWFDWDSLAEELMREMRKLAAGRPIQLAASGDELQLHTDPDLLKAALLNLLRNAVEALGEGPGQVHLQAVASPPQGVKLAVEDDGPGLSEEVRARLFEPFFTTKASGTGLGLPITKRLIEALGGELRLLKRQPTGTRAEVSLPHIQWRFGNPQEAHGSNSGG